MDVDNMEKVESSNSENYSKYSIFLQNLKAPLTKEQEQELFLKYANGDQEAKLEIFERNLRLVVIIAKKYINLADSLNMADLFQEGSIGLMTAIEKFDINKGYKFSTYATGWIKQKILRSINNIDSFVRLPVYINEEIKDLKSAVKFLTSKLKRKPTNKELAEYLNFNTDKIEIILATIYKVLSLNVGISQTDEDNMLQDFIVSNENIEENVINNSKREYINKVLNKVLTPKEQKILKLRYGLIDGKEKTLEEIGKIYHLTRERIRQIEAKALDKIRNSKEYEIIKEYKEADIEESQKIYIKSKKSYGLIEE